MTPYLENKVTTHINFATLLAPVPNMLDFSFFHYHIRYHILNMLKIKCDIKSARFENS